MKNHPNPEQETGPRWLQPRTPGRRIRRARQRAAGAFKLPAFARRRRARLNGFKPMTGLFASAAVSTVRHPNPERRALPGKARRLARKAANR